MVCLQTSAQQYNFKRYSVEEGLPRSGVYCVLQDSRGYLWTGTEGGGLSRFDGRQFVTFTIGNGLPDNTIRSLFEDQAGNLWIGTDGHGLCKYDGKTFETFTAEHGLTNEYIRCITQGTDGDIWIGTFGGGINRLRFENDTLIVSVYDKTETLKSDKVRAALRDSNGNLWFGTDEGLVSTDGENWKTFTPRSGLSHKRVLVLYEDKLNTLWVGTESGVNKLTQNGFVTFMPKDGLVDDRIRGICQDNLGNMWFGTQEGLSRFDGKNFTSFTEKNGLSNDRIRHITKDRSGNLWFGTYFGGICRFSGEEFIHFTEKDGVTSDQVLSIFNNDDGDTWLGTLEGVTELIPNSNGTWKIIRNPLGNDFSKRSINTIIKANDGTIWFGTDEGILIKDGKETTWLNTDGKRFDEDVKAILFDGNKHIWIGSSQGVTRFSNSKNGYTFNQYHSNANINESEVSCLYKDRFNRIWIGYLSAEPVIFQNDEFTTIVAPKMLSNVSGIATGANGTIWIGTEGGGIFKYQEAPEAVKSSDFDQIDLKDGLSSIDIHQLVFDQSGNLWAGTASGVDQILLNNRAEIKEVQYYGMPEGFIGVETNENATSIDAEGNLWFGTIRGGTRYNPKAKREFLVENRLHITRVNLEFEDADWNTSEYADGTEGYFNLPKNLLLPFSQNNLTIEYSGINLRTPRHVKYQWKLEGFSDEWSQVESKNFHSFTNLKPNEYTFNVRSNNGDGIWNETPITFTFKVLAPFWLKWWFIVLCALALIGLVWVIIKLREKRHLEEREKRHLEEKEKLQGMVDDRTKELRHEKDRSDALLLNILPAETANELKETGYASVRYYDRVSVLFTDFVGFTNITEGISHEQLVQSLDEHFRMFDEVMDKYRIEKIKTIGDAYMAAGGIPTKNDTNPLFVVAAGLEMVHRLAKINLQKEHDGEKPWKLRAGIHTGSVVSGVVGKNKFAFDIWGDAVNTAARMESSGDVMKVNISGSTYHLIKDYFDCTPRGKIKAKNKGEIEMYFVDGLKPEFCDNGETSVPNARFMSLISK